MAFTVDLSGVTLETKRLLLRPFEEGDLRDFNRYASVPGVGEMAGWPPHKSLDESKAIFIDVYRQQARTRHRAQAGR